MLYKAVWCMWYDRCVGTRAHYEHICTNLLILAAAARCPGLCYDPGNTAHHIAEFYTGQTVTT